MHTHTGSPELGGGSLFREEIPDVRVSTLLPGLGSHVC